MALRIVPTYTRGLLPFVRWQMSVCRKSVRVFLLGKLIFISDLHPTPEEQKFLIGFWKLRKWIKVCEKKWILASNGWKIIFKNLIYGEIEPRFGIRF